MKPTEPAAPAGPTADGDLPPFLGRWRNVYLVIAVELAITVALFAALTWWTS